MLRQASSRSHRSKGFKLKKALQICLLLVVSVWLLYQVKHSYDKNRAYDDGDSQLLHKDNNSQHDTFKFGRKDLPSGVEPGSTLETQTEEEEGEEIEELEQETKHEEDVDDDRAEGGDDVIDEQDQDNNGDSAVQSGGVLDVTEKGVFEDEENKERVNAAREKSFQGDDVASAVIHNTTEMEHVPHEGREKNYQDDNASSAVVHEIQVTEPASVNVTVRNLDEDHLNNGEKMVLDAENPANGTTEGSPRRNKSSVADEHRALSNDKFSYNSTEGEPSNHFGRTVDPITSNATNKPIEPELQTISASSNGPAEQQMNSAIASNSQVELPANLAFTSASRAPDVVVLTEATGEAGSRTVVDPAETNLSSSISSSVTHGIATE